MTICVFTGPTLPPAEARKYLDAEFLPPAAIGDVYSTACRGPWAIGIIDGIFENIPSVWHKEILWAMAQGIHVFGAASMGALRAAELSAFGMVGVGRIFEAYRDGEIEDDDEVAVVHGPPELGFIQTSEAMVNIRATLRKAASEGVLSTADSEALTGCAKSLYYKQRGYDRLLADAERVGLPAESVARLKAWLPANKVNQKRLDAIEMLEEIKSLRSAGRARKEVSYRFERTTFWVAVEREYTPGAAAENGGNATVTGDALFEELRLDAALSRQIKSASLLRLLVRQATAHREREPDLAQLQGATRRFVTTHGLKSAAELDAWLEDRGLSRDEFLELMADEGRRESLETSLRAALERVMASELRLDGAFADLRRRARHKQDILEKRGVAEPGLSDSGLSEQQLTDWIVGEFTPDGPDDGIEGVAKRLGFGDEHSLRRAALREYCYRLWKDS